MNFDSLFPGQTLRVTRFKYRTRARPEGPEGLPEHKVEIYGVCPGTRTIVASWNGLPPRLFTEQSIREWRLIQD